jgi:hypothetical protein
MAQATLSLRENALQNIPKQLGLVLLQEVSFLHRLALHLLSN